MSVVVTDNAYEVACGTCEVCLEEEMEIFRFDCGHWACEGCCYTVITDEGEGWSGCDSCEPPKEPNGTTRT